MAVDQIEKDFLWVPSSQKEWLLAQAGSHWLNIIDGPEKYDLWNQFVEYCAKNRLNPGLLALPNWAVLEPWLYMSFPRETLGAEPVYLLEIWAGAPTGERFREGYAMVIDGLPQSDFAPRWYCTAFRFNEEAIEQVSLSPVESEEADFVSWLKKETKRIGLLNINQYAPCVLPDFERKEQGQALADIFYKIFEDIQPYVKKLLRSK